jgi:hypothetical protein
MAETQEKGISFKIILIGDSGTNHLMKALARLR